MTQTASLYVVANLFDHIQDSLPIRNAHRSADAMVFELGSAVVTVFRHKAEIPENDEYTATAGCDGCWTGPVDVLDTDDIARLAFDA